MDEKIIEEQAFNLLAKADLDELYKLNKAALLGLLIEARSKLDLSDNRARKDIMQHYTNVGVRYFKNGR